MDYEERQAKKSEWGPSAWLMREDGPRTFADEALIKLRHEIVTGHFEPGEKLRPDLLEQQYGIGRNPIREALSRLAVEGLVRGEGQRGFQAAPVSRKELLDIADLRRTLSTMALTRSIQMGDENWEADVVAAYHRMSRMEKTLSGDPADYADEWEKRNSAFHAALESACGSPWLRHFCAILYEQSERYRRSAVRYPQLRPAIHTEHRAIMEACITRDEAKACRLLGDHIMAGAKATLVILEAREAGTSGKPARKKARAVPKAKPKRRAQK
ncbi:MAG TPA: FCD domain-containing protein [Magnetospirillaceae bacterium]|jgi:DNA-binding GntR family transcriptional regulator